MEDKICQRCGNKMELMIMRIQMGISLVGSGNVNVDTMIQKKTNQTMKRKIYWLV